MTKKQRILKIARESIRRAIRMRGTYSHNMCSCALRVVADKLGTKEANDLVDKFRLTGIFGIEKVST